MRDAITAPDDLRPSTCLRIGLTLDEALAPPVLPIPLDPAEVDVARRMFTIVSVTDGDRLAVPGPPSPRAFVIVSGRAVASRPGHRDLVISRGTTIGLRCMRQRRIQLRTVHALTDMQLLLIRCSAADQLDAALPRLATALDRCVDGACS
ncbi:MAG: hypothetical protein ABGZ36_10750 [Actinomycetota bacterium]|uniref:hypothetical protein n=1 Tax=Euzebya pacifica TaxID=1608957 RepID=UPI0030FACA15